MSDVAPPPPLDILGRRLGFCKVEECCCNYLQNTSTYEASSRLDKEKSCPMKQEFGISGIVEVEGPKVQTA